MTARSLDSDEIHLQRDYAQGRIEEKEVRTLFLNSLFEALRVDDSDIRQPLDFIYGSFVESDQKAFSVLDGQQRLTALFTALVFSC